MRNEQEERKKVCWEEDKTRRKKKEEWLPYGLKGKQLEGQKNPKPLASSQIFFFNV